MEKSISYIKTLEQISKWLQDRKNMDFSNKAMIVGIEGLCGAGKSTLAADLVLKMSQAGYNPVAIEADLFHFGRELVHKLYSNVIDSIRSGFLLECDFHHLITWKTHQLQSQVFDRINEFNNSSETNLGLVVDNVLTNKTNGTEHDEIFQINRESIVFVPATFLRYYDGLDYIIYLDIDLRVSIERKQVRTKNENIKRSDELTQNIISMLEQPTLEVLNMKISRQPDVIVDTNNFDMVGCNLK